MQHDISFIYLRFADFAHVARHVSSPSHPIYSFPLQATHSIRMEAVLRIPELLSLILSTLDSRRDLLAASQVNRLFRSATASTLFRQIYLYDEWHNEIGTLRLENRALVRSISFRVGSKASVSHLSSFLSTTPKAHSFALKRSSGSHTDPADTKAFFEILGILPEQTDELTLKLNDFEESSVAHQLASGLAVFPRVTTLAMVEPYHDELLASLRSVRASLRTLHISCQDAQSDSAHWKELVENMPAVEVLTMSSSYLDDTDLPAFPGTLRCLHLTECHAYHFEDLVDRLLDGSWSPNLQTISIKGPILSCGKRPSADSSAVSICVWHILQRQYDVREVDTLAFSREIVMEGAARVKSSVGSAMDDGDMDESLCR